MTYYDDVITGTSGVTHYWKFEGNLSDSIGSSSFTGATGYSTGTAGREGNALTADGSSKTGPYLPSLVTSGFFGSAHSIEFWFKYTSGSAQELMRVNDEVALEMNTDGTILYYVEGSSGTTSSSYGDGVWHHLVITRDSSRVTKVYIDGTSVISFTPGTTYPTSGNWYFAGSQYSAQAAISGQMDSIAVYTTDLSSGTITTHKNSMGAIYPIAAAVMTASATAVAPAISVTESNAATPMTASADMIAPTVHIAESDAAAPMTASAAMGDAHYAGDDYSYPGVKDYSTSGSGSATSLYLGTITGAEKDIYLQTDDVVIASGSGLGNAKLKLYVNGVFGFYPVSIDVYRITSSWTEGGSVPTKTFVKTVTVSPTASTVLDVDVTEVVVSWLGGSTNYGIALAPHTSAEGYLDIGSRESSHVPRLTAHVVVATDDSYSATPMTAAGTFVGPIIFAGDGSVHIYAEDAEAAAEMPGGTYSGPVTVAANAMTGTATTVDAAVSVEVGARITATPMTATSHWIKPSGVNGSPISIPETEDKYFNRVYAVPPKIWYRFLETSGTHADDRMNYGTDAGATYAGVDLGEFAGPEGRASVHFESGDYIRQVETGSFPAGEVTPTDANGVTRTTLEFGIRTTKKEQFIMGGRDNAQIQTRTATIESEQAARELYLRDGKIAMVTWYFPNSLGQSKDAYQFVGFKDIADGQWHHVVIMGYNNWSGEEGVEIWIDGKLEIRRTGNPSGAGPWNGMPDWIGLRPDTLDGEYLSGFPSSLNFEGDLSELAFYGTVIGANAVPLHYYDFMGWNPIGVAPMEAFAFTPAGAKGKGNQKRMLVLTYSPINGDMSYNPFLNDTGIYTFNGVVGNTGQFMGWKVFPVSVAFGPGGQVFRDKVTDVQTLISLKDDIDIKDYDAIAFTDWIWEPNTLPHQLNVEYERLIQEIRWACDQGLGLFITHPRLALDLGVIDRIEFAPSQKEIVSVLAQGNAQGLYDYGSAVDFPWNISATSAMDDTWGGSGSRFNGQPQNFDPAFLSNKAYFYGDTHKNDKFRVRALIAGLTDIPSYMTEKAIFQVDQSNYGWQIAAYKYLHRENGLQIGDEFIFWGTDYGFNNNWLSSMGLNSTGRWGGAYATPLDHVKAGTVVTTFGSQYWQAKSIIDNPYKEYATTIVLQPGDSLNGTPVGGKIYVNFTEQPWLQADQVARQIIPTTTDPADWPAAYNVETAAQREWDYSETRKSLSVTGTQSNNVTFQVALPDGSLAAITGSSGGNTSLNMVRSSELFDTEHLPSWQMNRRGLLWLYDSGVRDGAGDTTVRATPILANAEVKQPVTVAQKSNAVLAEPMRALAQMPKVAEDQTGDVQIITLPWEAHAEFTGFSRVVSATPMEATAEMTDPSEVSATGEQFVLYLQNVPQVTLFLKEEV